MNNKISILFEKLIKSKKNLMDNNKINEQERCKEEIDNSTSLFYDVLFNNRMIQNDKEYEDFRLCCLAMHSMISNDKFHYLISYFGGLDFIVGNNDIIHFIATELNVSDSLVKCRIQEEINHEMGYLPMDSYKKLKLEKK